MAMAMLIGPAGTEIEVYGQELDWVLISKDFRNPWYVKKSDIEYVKDVTPESVSYSDDSGMKFDVCNGKLIGINAIDRTQRLVINTSTDTGYPFQIGGIQKKENAANMLLNFRIGWDGSVYGGSANPWSISASGTATFAHLNASSGSLSSMTVSNVKITSGTIAGMSFNSGSLTAGDWTLSSAGLTNAEVGTLVLKKALTIWYVAAHDEKVKSTIPAKTLYGSCSVSQNILSDTLSGSCSVSFPETSIESTATFVYKLGYCERNIEYYGTPVTDTGVKFTGRD